MSVAILGLGTEAPTGSIAQPRAAELAKARCCTTDEQSRLLPVLYRRTRVGRRGSVLLDGPDASTQGEAFFPPAATGDDLGPSTRQRMERYAEHAGPLALAAATRNAALPSVTSIGG